MKRSGTCPSRWACVSGAGSPFRLAWPRPPADFPKVPALGVGTSCRGGPAGFSFFWSRIMPEVVAGIRIPDSKLAREATDLLREHGTPLLLAHSLRVYLFG